MSGNDSAKLKIPFRKSPKRKHPGNRVAELKPDLAPKATEIKMILRRKARFSSQREISSNIVSL
jgi:hypothetical protein